MKLEEIDFDNEDEVERLKDEKVEVPVYVLKELLDSFYHGGGEPDSLNERLKWVL
jgi:hypothetical protein